MEDGSGSLRDASRDPRQHPHPTGPPSVAAPITIDSNRDASSTVPIATRWAWGICWLMFASTILNYMDRQSVSLVGKEIKASFGLTTDEQLGWVMAIFYISYALCQVPAGFLADRVNVRKLYPLAVLGWSLAALAIAFAPTLGVLLIFRALLGLGESFNWPCALRVTSIVLPPKDRSLGNGIFNSGAAVGAVLAPLMIASLTAWFNWRVAFAVVSLLGIGWVWAWLHFVRGPEVEVFDEATRKINETRLEAGGRSGTMAGAARLGLVVLGLVPVAVLGSVKFYGLTGVWFAATAFMIGLLVLPLALGSRNCDGTPWLVDLDQVVRSRRFWVLVVVSISINVCWHSFLNWIPAFLKQDSRLSDLAAPGVTALMFLAADLGNIGGGAISRQLAGRGLEPPKARAIVMTCCAVLISSGALVGSAGSSAIVFLLLAIMAFGIAAFMANYFAFCQDVSSRLTGLVVGILGGLGNLFAGGFLPQAGAIKDRTGSFAVVFLLIGLLPFLGIGALWGGWGWRKSPESTSTAA